MTRRCELGFDIRLLKKLAFDASQSNLMRGKKIELFSSSAINKRKRSLLNRCTIAGLKAHLVPEQCELDYPAVILVRAKYGSNYIENLGDKLKKFPGILSGYNISENINFLRFWSLQE
ncbi:MAG: hypothetical protein QXM60_04520 [Thermoplasmatales archaeon]